MGGHLFIVVAINNRYGFLLSSVRSSRRECISEGSASASKINFGFLRNY